MENFNFEDTKVKQLTEAPDDDEGDDLPVVGDVEECDDEDCTEDDRCLLCKMSGMPARDI